MHHAECAVMCAMEDRQARVWVVIVGSVVCAAMLHIYAGNPHSESAVTLSQSFRPSECGGLMHLACGVISCRLCVKRYVGAGATSIASGQSSGLWPTNHMACNACVALHPVPHTTLFTTPCAVDWFQNKEGTFQASTSSTSQLFVSLTIDVAGCRPLDTCSIVNESSYYIIVPHSHASPYIYCYHPPPTTVALSRIVMSVPCG